MPNQAIPHVFLSYSAVDRDVVEALACRLHGDARLAFWFAPWHAVPGAPIQEQMEAALQHSQSCAVFFSGAIEGWQNEQMRSAIQTRVEDEHGYRVIPVLLPGASQPHRRDMPRFLRLFEPVEFRSLNDEYAFKRLLAGMLGMQPIEIEDYIRAKVEKERLSLPELEGFAHGHALVIGVANYPKLKPLPETILSDAHDLYNLLTDPAICGYPITQVSQLLDHEATGDRIRTALTELALRTGPDDTVIVFFSGHGAHDLNSENKQYILPYDCLLNDLDGTAISGEEMTALVRQIQAGRLVVLFDACHSGGAGDPKGMLANLKQGLGECYFEGLAQGKGRVIMASSRPDEVSWALGDMKNSLFTHYLLEALRGQAKTLGDGYVRVFDVFRHIAEHVPLQAQMVNVSQHPVFKAAAMEEDFPIALVKT